MDVHGGRRHTNNRHNTNNNNCHECFRMLYLGPRQRCIALKMKNMCRTLNFRPSAIQRNAELIALINSLTNCHRRNAVHDSVGGFHVYVVLRDVMRTCTNQFTKFV